jgi:hypothetical protein
MRKTLFILLAAATVTAVGVLAGTTQAATIIGSKHDFSAYSWSGNQICQPCHTPHNAIMLDANGKQIDAPLWNHQLSSASYALHDGTLTGKANGEVDSRSRLCLSCHDGTVALDSFGGATGGTTMTGSAMLGNDLSNDHPIGETAKYTTSTTTTSWVQLSLWGSKPTSGGLPLRYLSDGTTLVVSCVTCHEPHNKVGVEKLLRVSNSGAGTTLIDKRSVPGSTLCFSCHIR